MEKHRYLISGMTVLWRQPGGVCGYTRENLHLCKKTNPEHSTNFCPSYESIFYIGESKLVSGRCILLGWIPPRAQYQFGALKGITFLFWHRWIGRVIWLLEGGETSVSLEEQLEVGPQTFLILSNAVIPLEHPTSEQNKNKITKCDSLSKWIPCDFLPQLVCQIKLI